MYSQSFCASLQGLEVTLVQIETDLSEGLPVFDMVGLLSSEVREAKERVRVALRNSGFSIPAKRITINLSPADVPKEGTGFDLGIAASILGCLGILDRKQLERILFIGELGLDGRVCPVRGVLPMILAARKCGIGVCLVPAENAKEAAAVEGMMIFAVNDLKEAVTVLRHPKENSARRMPFAGKDNWRIIEENRPEDGMDFADIVGQEYAKKAALIAAAGMHHLLLIGPPGSGKTMLAKRIPGIMPSLSLEEAIEISKIYSVAGELTNGQQFITRRPFRSPHNNMTQAALNGGGRNPRPGEVSLAMGGVLFMDEFPEFRREVIESLRQPLEEQQIWITRCGGTFAFPTRFLLVGAMNPCPCGNYPDMERCSCTPHKISQYLHRISEPIIDRIDLSAEMSRVEPEEIAMHGQMTAESGADDYTTEKMKARVETAAEIQKKRYAGEAFSFNSELPPQAIRRYCRLEPEGETKLKEIAALHSLSMRGYHKILKIGRTIADLNGRDVITQEDIMTASTYRNEKQRFWGEAVT